MNILPLVTFSLSFFAACMLLALMAWSIKFPRWRIWPPPDGRASWHLVLVWVLSVITFGGGTVVGLLDLGTLYSDAQYLRWTGFVLLAAGLSILVWGQVTLGALQTFGLKGRLVMHGPYRITRNPQYVGDVILTVGFVLATGSVLAAALAVPLVGALIAFPFTEEPWLRTQFGADYEHYTQRVPRFLGRGSVPKISH